MNYKIVGSTATALLLGVPLCVISFYVGTDGQSRCFNVLLLIVGLLLGWLLGTLATPYTDKEEKAFTGYAKAISAFVSGFVIAKADKAIEHVLSPETLSNTVSLFRLGLFVAGVLLGLIVTFIFRRYA